MDFAPLIATKTERFRELEEVVSAPDFYDNPKRARELMREQARLKDLIETWDNLQKMEAELVDSVQLGKSDDPEMAEMAKAEIPVLEASIEEAKLKVQMALLPPELNEDKDAIIEIRAGTGGSEAAIFSADLYRMYCKHAEIIGMKIEELEASSSELGGLKEVIFKMTGDSVFRKMKFESGVHRVQRVPATEAQGRIHTSTATVAVLPEAEEVDLVLNMDEIRIEVCRAGGPGGQGVNTTDSAVQVMHMPSGTIVRCQDGRSQQKNKAKALTILRSRLLEKKQREEHEQYAAQRKSQVGTGERSEKIRTYNYPQNRVTDHRIGLTLYNLDRFMEGELKPMLDALQANDMQERLAEVQATQLV